MSWVKMDDQWPFHRKLRLVEPLDRLLWSMSIAYCSSQNTDGRLDPQMLEMVAFCAGVADPQAAAERLTEAGLFERAKDAWTVHDYLGFQPSAEQRKHISEQRSEAGKRGGQKSGKRRSTSPKQAEPKPEANGKQVASGLVQHFGTPSRPVPSRPVPSSVTSSGPLSSSVKGGCGGRDDDDSRIKESLPHVAQGLAEIYGIEPQRRPGYRAAILRDPSDHYDAIAVIASDHPTAGAQQLAEHYLATRQPAPGAQPRCGICHEPPHPNGTICPTLEEP